MSAGSLPDASLSAGNLFAGLCAPAAAEQVETLASGTATRVERIVSHGHASPPGFWYDQDGPEFVVLLQGEAVLGFADGTHCRLAAGDHLTIPAGARHRVEHTSSDPPAIWLAVHFRS
jgi:cupin 2 domain-containing protein